MKAKNAEEIFNLYDFLPGYGESSVELIWKPGTARLLIHYESESESDALNLMEFIFEGCSDCEISSFPGVCLYECDSGGISLGSLMEFKTSDYANLWNKHFGYLESEIRHFSVLFLSENKRFTVFAENFNYIIHNKAI